MATSSIFTNFDIKDKKTARAFVAALEEADRLKREEDRQPKKKLDYALVVDPEEIRRFFDGVEFGK